MANRKAFRPDEGSSFLFKRFKSPHGLIAESLWDSVLIVVKHLIGLWRQRLLIKKVHAKWTVAGNYRPIACWSCMCKLLTGILAEKLHYHMQREVCGTKDKLLIDKTFLREPQVKRRCLAMGWIDYRRAYATV